jgi:hypothetical protein
MAGHSLRRRRRRYCCNGNLQLGRPLMSGSVSGSATWCRNRRAGLLASDIPEGRLKSGEYTSQRRQGRRDTSEHGRGAGGRQLRRGGLRPLGQRQRHADEGAPTRRSRRPARGTRWTKPASRPGTTSMIPSASACNGAPCGRSVAASWRSWPRRQPGADIEKPASGRVQKPARLRSLDTPAPELGWLVYHGPVGRWVQ